MAPPAYVAPPPQASPRMPLLIQLPTGLLPVPYRPDMKVCELAVEIERLAMGSGGITQRHLPKEELHLVYTRTPGGQPDTVYLGSKAADKLARVGSRQSWSPAAHQITLAQAGIEAGGSPLVHTDPLAAMRLARESCETGSATAAAAEAAWRAQHDHDVRGGRRHVRLPPSVPARERMDYLAGSSGGAAAAEQAARQLGFPAADIEAVQSFRHSQVRAPHNMDCSPTRWP